MSHEHHWLDGIIAEKLFLQNENPHDIAQAISKSNRLIDAIAAGIQEANRAGLQGHEIRAQRIREAILLVFCNPPTT
jgi:hypothetical protein